MATTSKTTASGKAPRVGKTQANKTALRDAIAAMNDGSAEKYLTLFRPDAQLHGFPQGIDDVESLSAFHTATAGLFPDASVSLDDAVAERDRVATRYTWRASQAPGVTLVAQGGAIVRFADGQIVECWNLPSELEAVVG
jgi:predicted ester cyclase